MSDAPVQVLVLRVPDAASGAAVLASLEALRGADAVGLVDAFVADVRDDGVHVDDEVASRPAVRLLLGDPDDGPEPQDSSDAPATWDLADAAGSGAAVVVLLEHLWAAELRAPIEAAGASLLDEVWLDAGDRARLRA
jgi:hypothetical protein